MFEWLSSIGVFTTIALFINFIIAIGIIFRERKNPSATLAWIFILFVLPVFGTVCYLFLSQNISRKRLFKLSKNEEYFVRKSLKEQVEEMAGGNFPYSDEAYTWRDMVRLNQTYGGAYYTQDNTADIITDGGDFMKSLLSDIKAAKSTINVEFYIVKYDEVGKSLIKALEEKAAEGVEVRFLVDAVGGREIWEKKLEGLTAAGGKFAFFFRPKLRVVNLKLNYRNHRKLVTIDGRIGYIGGFNVGREYLGRKKRFGYWRDTALRFYGGCVRDIDGRFLLDWREASGEDSPLSKVWYEPARSNGKTGVQIVSSGPNSQKEEIKRGYMKMITSARKNVYIQTPYFIPDQSILESLKMAAQAGVDVRIMIPCMPDHMFVYWATYSYAADLVASGGRVFVYDKGFLHSKLIIADGEVFSCGSANFDRRSFSLNFEANAFVYDAEEAERMERIFERDMLDCHELTRKLYESRSPWIKFKESISRLLSDLL